MAIISRVSGHQAETVVREAAGRGGIVGVRLSLPEDEDEEPWTAPPSRRRKEAPIAGPLPSTLELVLGDQIYISKEGLPAPLRNRLIRLAAFQNPEFDTPIGMQLQAAPSLNNPVWITVPVAGGTNCIELPLSIGNKFFRMVTPVAIPQLIVRLARENRTWGCGLIDGALLNLGHDVGRSTIARVLKKAGIEPAPERKKGMSWPEFLRSHWDVLAATDFFTAEVWTARGLIRYHVLFVIRLATREVRIAGLVPEPYDMWMKQIARNLTLRLRALHCAQGHPEREGAQAPRVEWVTDGIDGFLPGCKYLIHDRAPSFSKSFRGILKNCGVKSIRLPRKSPNLNSFAERWVRTAKELCVHRMMLFGENSLRRALAEMEPFYNRERPHQGLGNKIIQPDFDEPATKGTIRCRSRLGRTLNYYYREAA